MNGNAVVVVVAAALLRGYSTTGGAAYTIDASNIFRWYRCKSIKNGGVGEQVLNTLLQVPTIDASNRVRWRWWRAGGGAGSGGTQTEVGVAEAVD